MYMQRGCDHTVIRVDIIQLNSVFKQCPGLTSHQVFRLADMGEKVRISAAADRLVEGHQRNISGNLDVQRGQQVVKVGTGEDSAVINAVTRFWVIRFRNRSW